jgi:hypothetical protein
MRMLAQEADLGVWRVRSAVSESGNCRPAEGMPFGDTMHESIPFLAKGDPRMEHRGRGEAAAEKRRP